MNIAILITLGVVATLAALSLWIYRRCKPKPEATVEIELPPRVTDPALPDIQNRAVERLLRLSHFRRILDGSLFDYYQGARLETCDCTKLPYPHLTLDYGGKLGVLFETAGALEHYVAVQEAVAAMLTSGINQFPSPAPEDR